MKVFNLIIFVLFGFFCNFTYAQEKSILEEFSCSPKFVLGGGISLVAESHKPYANAKLFIFRYGEDYAGMRFLGLGGTLTTSHSNLSFSPVGIHLNQWTISVDMVKDASDGAGISLNYSF